MSLVVHGGEGDTTHETGVGRVVTSVLAGRAQPLSPKTAWRLSLYSAVCDGRERAARPLAPAWSGPEDPGQAYFFHLSTSLSCLEVLV